MFPSLVIQEEPTRFKFLDMVRKCLAPFASSASSLTPQNSIENALDCIRHLINTSHLTHVVIDINATPTSSPQRNTSPNAFKIAIYPHETIIYARGKRLSYINCPINIIASHTRVANSANLIAYVRQNTHSEIKDVIAKSLHQLTPQHIKIKIMDNV